MPLDTHDVWLLSPWLSGGDLDVHRTDRCEVDADLGLDPHVFDDNELKEACEVWWNLPEGVLDETYVIIENKRARSRTGGREWLVYPQGTRSRDVDVRISPGRVQTVSRRPRRLTRLRRS